MHNENRPEASVQKTLTASAPGQADRSSPIYPPVIKIAYRGNERVKVSDTCGKRRKFRSNCVGNDKAPTNDSTPKNRNRKSNEPSTAGGRERRLKARPPVRFSSLRSPRLVNQKQEPSGNTLLAQRYPLSGNSYFWRTAQLLRHRCLTNPLPLPWFRHMFVQHFVAEIWVMRFPMKTNKEFSKKKPAPRAKSGGKKARRKQPGSNPGATTKQVASSAVAPQRRAPQVASH